MYLNEDKIKVEEVEVAGFKTAIRGMRNPMNSWHLADSITYSDGSFFLGENDRSLAKRLIKAGSEHCKFLRQIYVGFDITLPRYVWSEFDTYGFSPKNSCSTMHKLLNKKDGVSLDQFVYDEADLPKMLDSIAELNILRDRYISPDINGKEKNEILRRAKQRLPEGFLQKRTVATNYAVLRNIYHQRCFHKHRLPEWEIFGKFIESLPYAKDLILYGLQ